MPTDPRPVFHISSKPGIQRDGTTLDATQFVDGQWVRFYHSRPRKMGGYRAIVEDLSFPSRGVFTFSKNNSNSIYLFNSWGARLVQTDNNLTGTISYDVSPAALAYDPLYRWQAAGIYDSTGGGDNMVIAHPAKNLTDISSSANSSVYYTTAGDPSQAFATISNGAGGTVDVSGGVCVLQPYVFAYGNDGLIMNSNLNKPNDWTMGVGKDANEVNVAYTKIVKGLPVRGGGQSPSGLFWSLDSVIKVSYVGGGAVFRYDQVGASTIMSSESVVELDGAFFWMGIDRFYGFDGRVQELPNNSNLNWVFDHLNFEQRQKVWATAVPRWGEIWWFFPMGEDEEAGYAAIYNVREKCWYDARIERGCGVPSQTLRYPIWCGTSPVATSDVSSVVTVSIASPGAVTWASHYLQIGQEVIFSSTGSLPTGLNINTSYYVATIPTRSTFTLAASPLGSPIVTTGTQSGVHTLTAKAKPEYAAYGHEIGYNKVESGNELAIESYIETSDFGFPTGGAVSEQPQGQDYFTRLIRVEPDFVQTGDLTLSVIGTEFAQDNAPKQTDYTFSPTTTKVDMREQRRMIRLRFTSNEVGGFFEMGKPILHIEAGDIRS